MKYYIIVVIRNILKLFFLFPIHKNRIIFTAYNGKQYGCNPKYISEYIESESKKLDIVWAFENPKNYKLNSNVKLVKYKSLKYIYYVMTAKVVVENSESWSIIPKRMGQVVINTWHGGGAYKKVGKSRKDGSSFNDKNVQYKNNRIDHYISSSEAFTIQTLLDSFGFKGNVMEIGMPRNDILINSDEQLKQSVKEKLNVDGKNIVMIAPTFRNKTDFALESFDFEALLEQISMKFGGSWVILYRSHYYEVNKLEDNLLINVSDYPDMQELLLITDVLITDFSSCMWDFSLSFKPVFLLSSDLKEYQAKEREFYTDPYSWPFPLALTFELLLENINDYNENAYKAKVSQHHNDLGSFEHGTASKDIGDFIIRTILKEESNG